MLTRLSLSFLLVVAAPVLAQSGGQVEPLTVEIVRVAPVTKTRSISLTGELRARDSVSAAFPVAGRVIEVAVEQGESVAAGAVLARLDSVQQQQALRAAEAGLETAQADARQAQEDLDRAEALLERGATTRAARDQAEDAQHVAAGALAQARADLDRAQKALDDTVLRAPREATVTARMVELGQVVGAAHPVFELALSNGIEAVFDVPEAMLTQDVGREPILLSRLSDPTVTFWGQVSDTAPLVDATTGTVAVTVRVEDPPPGLVFGAAVRGTATFEEPDQIVLPHTALSALGDGPAVWTVDPQTDRVTLHPVEVGAYAVGSFVVASGLEPGDLVVARGAQLLYPGRLVRAWEGGQ